VGKVSLRIDTRPRKRNAPRPAWKVCKSYLQWLRGRPCAFERLGDCSGKIEAAHTPDPASKGIGTKAADKNAIPACQGHHRLHTVKGWSAVGLTRETAQALAAAYWKAWRGDKGDLA
jgi:hypothetical protein